MEQNEQPKALPPYFESPARQIWLLVALNFACTGIFLLFTKFEALDWLVAGPEDNSPSWMGKLSNALYGIIIFAVPSIVLANALSPDRFYSFKLHRKVPIVPLILGMVALLSSVFFVDLVYTWNRTIMNDPALLEQDKISSAYTSWILQMPDVASLVLCLFANAFVPALVEELFFRAGLQQMLIRWVKKHHAAIFLSAAFFSFLHFEASGFLVRFILGVALGYLFYWSGSLRLPILAHFAFNSFTIVNSYVMQHYAQSGWAQMETTYTLAIISLVVSLGALFTCRSLLLRGTAGEQGAFPLG